MKKLNIKRSVADALNKGTMIHTVGINTSKERRKKFSIRPVAATNISLKSLLITLFAAALPGCKKFVEINPPTNQLVTASVFTNGAAVTSAVTAIYSQIENNFEAYNIAQNTGLLGDELTNFSTYSPQVQFYTNSMQSVTGPGPWQDAYNYIYQANSIIEGLQGNSAINDAIMRQLSGEAKFIRAFWLFYLINLYGDVPLVTTTNYQTNSSIPRASQASVYKQIILDLKDAQSLLSTNFVDGTDTTVTTERTRPTSWAATALLARVYLYTNDWTDAEAQATAVINHTSLFGLVNSLDDVFLTNSQEAIWQIQIPQPLSGVNTWEGAYFILTGAPLSNTQNSTTISPQLLSSFEPNDNRRVSWIDSIIVSGTTYYFPFKYKVYQASTVSEYAMVLRLAEQILIRAEARAEEGGSSLSGAIADLNTVRSRAGLSFTTATSQADLLTAIYHERQVELFTEWGHRWMDLKRTGIVNTVLGAPGDLSRAKGGPIWSQNLQLYPIPQSERALDVNLTQNTGYN